RMSSVVLLRRPLRSSLFPYTTLFRSLADELQQAGQLARIGDHVEWPVLQQPLRAAAEESLGRGADVGDLQCAVGGQDHVADAFRQQAVAPLALAQAGLRGDLAGDVLGHTDQAADPAEAVAAEGMFADLEPVPAAVAVTPTQLALEHLPVADHFLQVAHALVQLDIVRVEDFFPQALAKALYLFLAVA